MRKVLRSVLVLTLIGSASSAALRPTAVSPGSHDQLSLTAERCPTFSWDPAAKATAHEIVIYRIIEGGRESMPVLRRVVPGAASSWTPSLDQCLIAGDRYAWSVRAIHQKNAGEWSRPSLFQISAGPSERQFQEALQVVRQYLGKHEDLATVETSEEGRSRDPAGSGSGLTTDESDSAAPAPTQMSVDGNVDAVSFTGDGSNLDGVTTDAELIVHGGDASAHHTPTVDTNCSGAACDGTNFSNVTAVAGDSATAFFSSGEIEESRIDSAIARDSEVAGLAGWSLTGNAGTSPPTNFLGTTDPQPLELRANDTTLLRLAVDAEIFSDSSTAAPIDILDNNPLGITDNIVVPDRGIASELAVSVHLTNSDLTTILVELTDPNAVTYTLFAGGAAGTVLNTSFPTPTPPVSGDLTTWIGQNPAGTWELKIVDSGFLNNTTDGQLLDWSIDLETLSDPNVQVSSRLAVVGDVTATGVSVAGDISASGTLTATAFVGSGLALTGVAPSGPAGGDLGGSYPNPSVLNAQNAQNASGLQCPGCVDPSDLAFDHVPDVTEAIFGSGPITLFTRPRWVLEAVDGNTIQIRQTVSGGFYNVALTHPANCVDVGRAGSADMQQQFMFSTTAGETLSADLCAEGSTMFITVDRGDDDGDDTFHFRCWRRTSNHIRCQQTSPLP